MFRAYPFGMINLNLAIAIGIKPFWCRCLKSAKRLSQVTIIINVLSFSNTRTETSLADTPEKSKMGSMRRRVVVPG